MSDDRDHDMRDAARRQLVARSGAWRYLAVCVVLWILFVVIWAVTGARYFWPVWPIAGMAIGLAFAFLNAYGGLGAPTESRIDREVERMRRRDGRGL